jgi:murein DD-endopeptidase MepM/ murein hydrolase activator NlpD
MHNRFTITIHDVNGVKQFNLHQAVKKVIKYAIGGLFGFLFVGAALILFLNGQLDAIQAKKEKVEEAYRELNERNAGLQESIALTEQNLEAKQQEFDVMSDRLEAIESLIGLAPSQETTLKERVDIARLTSAQMAALLQYIPNGSPVEYKGITSKFGYRIHPVLGKRELHRGSDMRAAMNTPVYATASGVIEYAGTHKTSGYGKLVIIDHNYGFKTFFGHLKKIVVKSGHYVKKGELIAYSGNSGMSNGPHLHYEVRFIQRALNPYWFIKWNVENYRQIFEKEKKVPWQSLIKAITRDKRQLEAKPATIPPLSPRELLSRAK